MKKFYLLLFSIALIFTIQSCNKNNNKSASTDTGQPINSASVGEKLKINAAGQYGTFKFSSANGGKSAEIANFSLTDGGTSDVADFTGAEHQLWRLTDLGNGYIKIMNCGSGKFAQSYLYAGAQRFIQVYSNSSDSQQWSITSAGNGYYTIINKATGLALTNPGAGILSLTSYANNNTQWWNFSLQANHAYRDDAVVNFFHRTHGSISFDQGNSIPLSYGPNNGKTLWIAEDTYTDRLLKPNGKFNCPQFFDVHNSALVQPASQSWDQALTPNLVTHNSTYYAEIIASPGQHNSSYTWPGVGIEVGNHVYMYAAEGPASNGFNKTVIYDFTENASGGLDWGTGVRHEVVGVSDQDTIGYACGMVKPGDGYVYAFGARGIFLFKNMYVARFAENDPFHWTFWNGTTWAARPTIATAAIIHFIGHDDGALANTAISYANGKYVMMQMDLGYFCDNTPHSIYMSTATSPTGPFTNKKEVFSIEDRINGHLCNYYTPCLHPQFNNGKNELLVTYCLNYTGCSGVSTCTNGYLDPNFYQVKGVRIPYSLIGL